MNSISIHASCFGKTCFPVGKATLRMPRGVPVTVLPWLRRDVTFLGHPGALVGHFLKTWELM